MEPQKELRSELKELEHCEGQHEFVDSCSRFVDRLVCFDLPYTKEREFKDILKPVFENEPWNFIAMKPSRTYLWLCDLHGKLVKKLKNGKDK